ncbi:MAG: hypothetical protein HN509_02045 [Halobacteriovoraceae bacterium]|jgi:hypothetical protein|nr:hypothetical protein [Halobacteriovoraceae bacterium]
MKNILVVAMTLLFFSASANALTVKSQTRVLNVNFSENLVKVELCNIHGKGCLTDVISETEVGARMQRAVDQLKELINDKVAQEELRSKMLSEIKSTGKSIYTIPAIGHLTVKGSAYLDRLFNNTIPASLRQIEAHRKRPSLSKNLKKYLPVKDKSITLAGEKEFGEFLDNLLSDLFIVLK